MNKDGKLDLFERSLDYKAFEELVLNDNENDDSEDEDFAEEYSYDEESDDSDYADEE